MQTAKLLLRMFDDLKPLHKLGDRERELMEYAAWLHDIGWHIGNTRHHKHSAYLVRHGRLQTVDTRHAHHSGRGRRTTG